LANTLTTFSPKNVFANPGKRLYETPLIIENKCFPE
jgi:hypothetical protein